MTRRHEMPLGSGPCGSLTDEEEALLDRINPPRKDWRVTSVEKEEGVVRRYSWSRLNSQQVGRYAEGLHGEHRAGRPVGGSRLVDDEWNAERAYVLED